MPDPIRLRIDGVAREVSPGTTVAAALLGAGTHAFRRSITGRPRGPVCGMGICFECCVTIDGKPHQRSCRILCESDMEVTTGA